jgi:hypothetical protein
MPGKLLRNRDRERRVSRLEGPYLGRASALWHAFAQIDDQAFAHVSLHSRAPGIAARAVNAELEARSLCLPPQLHEAVEYIALLCRPLRTRLIADGKSIPSMGRESRKFQRPCFYRSVHPTDPKRAIGAGVQPAQSKVRDLGGHRRSHRVERIEPDERILCAESALLDRAVDTISLPSFWDTSPARRPPHAKHGKRRRRLPSRHLWAQRSLLPLRVIGRVGKSRVVFPKH